MKNTITDPSDKVLRAQLMLREQVIQSVLTKFIGYSYASVDAVDYLYPHFDDVSTQEH